MKSIEQQYQDELHEAKLEIVRLQKLLMQAADALESRLVANNKDYWLVKELRKAAQ